MIVKKIGYMFLFLALCSNWAYAYRGKKMPKISQKEQTEKRNSNSFSILTYLKQKFSTPTDRLRLSRSEKKYMQSLVHKRLTKSSQQTMTPKQITL